MIIAVSRCAAASAPAATYIGSILWQWVGFWLSFLFGTNIVTGTVTTPVTSHQRWKRENPLLNNVTQSPGCGIRKKLYPMRCDARQLLRCFDPATSFSTMILFRCEGHSSQTLMDLGRPMPFGRYSLHRWMEVSIEVLMYACHFRLDGHALCYESTTSDIIIYSAGYINGLLARWSSRASLKNCSKGDSEVVTSCQLINTY